MKPDLSKSFSNHRFSKLAHLDGRILTACAICVYAIFLGRAYYYSNYSNLLWDLGVPVACCPFFDLKVITVGLDEFKRGMDPLAAFPKDTSIYTLYNYPRLWYYFSYLGIGEVHTILAGFVLIIVFLFTVFVLLEKISLIEGVLYGIILCSPAITFLLDRGNSDTIIFILLSLSALLLKNDNRLLNLMSSALFLLSCFLKLFPIFAIGLYLKFKCKTSGTYASLIVIIFFMYILGIGSELTLIRESTPRALVTAFGAFVIPDNLLVNTNVVDISSAFYQLFSKDVPANFLDKVHLLTMAVLLTVMVIVFLGTAHVSSSYSIDTSKIDLFRTGAGICIGTYLLGNNWDYRLTFLILTLPQIVIWCKSNSKLKYVSVSALGCSIICFWNPLLYKLITHHYLATLWVEELVNLFLFIYLFSMLTQTLPDWIRKKLFFFMPRKQKSNFA